MMTHPTPGKTMGPRPDWTAPHLLAGRGRAGLIAAGLLILAGALTDTLAFKNTLELALPQVSGPLAWAMATGATSMALVAAAVLGISLAVHRRTRGHRGTRLPMNFTGAVWVGLGLAMFLVRWLDTGASTPSSTFGSTASSAHPTPLVALFFAAIYLISGACTIFEAERLYNPEYFAYVRLAKQYKKQAQTVAEAEATVERARAAVDHHDGELDREDYRRQAAITERQALGAAAANYARLLMAAMLHDPAKTGLTETGPIPQLPAPLDDANAAGPDDEPAAA
ncbi:MAG: hypothetical protein ACRDPY_11915 [Streptosporangiaceae bacterium]